MIFEPDDELEQLLVNRTAPVTPHLEKQLETIGLKLDSSASEFRLPDEVHPFDTTRVTDGFDARDIDLKIFRTIGSTNDYIMSQQKRSDARINVALAEMQSAGKGRRGRSWVSPFGRNIYVTIGRYFQMPLREFGGLSLIAGMQLVETLRSHGLQQVGLKWPNDVLLDRGKMAGILTELGPAESRGIGVAIGIGINLALDADAAAAIDQAWSDAASRHHLDRNRLAGDLIVAIVDALEEFEENGFAPFAARWDKYNLYAGEKVRILRGDSVIEGVDRGVTRGGDLLLETSDGLLPFNSGEVSLRPAS